MHPTHGVVTAISSDARIFTLRPSLSLASHIPRHRFAFADRAYADHPTHPSRTAPMTAWKNKPLDVRKAEANKIRTKSPGQVPVMVPHKVSIWFSTPEMRGVTAFSSAAAVASYL